MASNIQQLLNGTGLEGPAIRALAQCFSEKIKSAFTTADVTYTSNGTLAAISGLSIPVKSNSTYILYGVFGLSIANAAHNIQFALDGGTCTANLIEGNGRFSLANGTATNTRVSALNTDIDGGTANAWTLFELSAILRVQHGGLLIARGSQQTSGASNSIVRSGAYLLAFDIST